MNRLAITVVVLVVQFCTVGWTCADGAIKSWILGPSPLNFGVVVDNHVLSYHWEPKEPKDIPEYWRNLIRRDLLMPAERWMSPEKGEKWEPKDIQWYWADLGRGDVKPLKAVMPQEAEALSRLSPSTGAPFKPHNAPHRWRVSPGYLCATTATSESGIIPAMPLLLRMPFPFGKQSGPRRDDRRSTGFESSQVPTRQSERDSEPAQGLPSWMLKEAVVEPNFGPDNPYHPTKRPYVLSRMKVVSVAAIDGRRQAHYRYDFDFVAVSSEHVAVFVLVGDKLTAWDYELRFSRAMTSETEWHAQWRRRGTFAAPFCEPFHVAVDDGVYFFVTDSGAVYMAEEVKGEWKTRALWKEPNRPIIAMLTQSDSTGAFVFGKDFYFQLARDVKPKPCEDVTKGDQKLGEPMRTVLQCARVLYKIGRAHV